MHAPQRALADVRGEIGLRDRRLEAMSLEFVLAEGPCEEASFILPAFEIKDERAHKLGSDKFQGSPPRFSQITLASDPCGSDGRL